MTTLFKIFKGEIIQPGGDDPRGLLQGFKNAGLNFIRATRVHQDPQGAIPQGFPAPVQLAAHYGYAAGQGL